MEFTIPVGSKFACMALEGVSLAGSLSKPLELGDGLQARFEPPFEIPQHWQEWLGSIQTRHFSKSNLFLLATHPSDQIGASARELEQKVWSLFYATLMHGIPHYEAGLLLSGENGPDSVNVRSVTTLYPYYRPAKFKRAEIGEDTLRSAADAAAGLQTIYENKQDYRRLKRGFEAWIKGVREEVGIYRLHQFVRAVEAVVKPSTDQAREQFIERCKLFAVGSAQVLAELYDLRTCVEHMNDWRAVLKLDSSQSDQDTVGWKRAYQAELLAGHVYLRILKEDNLRSNFINDDSIDQFWAEPGWRETINLETETRKRFLDSD
jgi:hypothetical protein